jgi:hypothetical protein
MGKVRSDNFTHTTSQGRTQGAAARQPLPQIPKTEISKAQIL